jgi:hypothetical protein
MTQLDFILPAPPTVSQEDVEAVIAVLRGHGWMNADQILGALGQEPREWRRRRIRAIANASSGQILSYPGSPGYRLTLEASIPEIESAAILNHQANEMRRRWIEIERVRHGRFRMPAPS